MNDLLIHVSRRAMACEFEVRFPAEQYPQGTEFALESLDLVEALEEQISYFRPTSELSRLNLLAAEQPVELTPPLFDLLSLAMTLYEETGGAYDVTSAPLWEAWGFARRSGEVPSPAQLAEAQSCVGGHLVELDPVRRTVRFRKPGVRINLGSIGKGYALDLCAERLLALGIADFLLHGGQSSVLARGQTRWGRHSCLHRGPIRNVCPTCPSLGRLAFATRGSPAGGWESFGSTTGHWEPRAGNSNRSGIADAAMDTSSIRDRAGRPKACCRRRSWPPRPPWPMPSRPPSTSWDRTARWTTAGPIRELARS